MKVKSGVQLSGVHYLLWIAAAYYDHLRLTNGLGEGTITGGTEGADLVGASRVSGTMHPIGRAIDLRTNDLPRHLWQPIADALHQALGPSFDIVVEVDHIHIEVMVGFVPGFA